MNHKHGLRKHPLYEVWINIKNRCYNKSIKGYKNYGARGIVMCDEWLNSAKAFLDWAINKWSLGLQIDRIDVNGNYCPENCRFINNRQNASNRRNKSIYGTGIYKTRGGKFQVQIEINNKCYSCGSYYTLEDAQKAYQNKVLEIKNKGV